MKLSFSEHISAKTQQYVQLTLYPGGNPDDYITEQEERTAGEGEATTTVYEFPDDMVVTAATVFGDAVIMEEDEPVSMEIDVHIGAKADPALAAAAEAAARKKFAQSPARERPQDGFLETPSGVSIVRHE